MNYDFNLKKIADADPALVENLIEELEHFPFSGNNYFSSPDHMLVYDFLPQELSDNVKKIVHSLNHVIDSYTFHSASIDCMLPNSYICEHVDQSVTDAPIHGILSTLHKIHVPLVTNTYAKQIWIDKESTIKNPFLIHLEKGSVYAYNNITPHAAINLGPSKRYHLILRYRYNRKYDWM